MFKVYKFLLIIIFMFSDNALGFPKPVVDTLRVQASAISGTAWNMENILIKASSAGSAEPDYSANKADIVYITTEMMGLIARGGLADTSRSLPNALNSRGKKAVVIMPFYKSSDLKGFVLAHTGVRVYVNIEGRLVEIDVLKVKMGNLEIYLLSNEEYFDEPYSGTPEDELNKSILLSSGALEAIKELHIKPEIIHANDWHTGLVPMYMRTAYKHIFNKTASVFTIHNLAYQGKYGIGDGTVGRYLYKISLGGKISSNEIFNINGIEFYGGINLIKAGIVYADRVNTVSPRYRHETLMPGFGSGLEGVLRAKSIDYDGILNGLDLSDWNPQTDNKIDYNYNIANAAKAKAMNKASLQLSLGLETKNVPLIGYSGRLNRIKGIDILLEAIKNIMEETDAQFIMCSSKNPDYDKRINALLEQYKGRLSITTAFNHELERRLFASCDMLIVPSVVEPCGLVQMKAMLYGAVPIVHNTGGLADTVFDYDKAGEESNGFVFDEYSSGALYEAVEKALKIFNIKQEWRRLMANGMSGDFSWERTVGDYEKLYLSAQRDRMPKTIEDVKTSSAGMALDGKGIAASYYQANKDHIKAYEQILMAA
jgi:starch synthase